MYKNAMNAAHMPAMLQRNTSIRFPLLHAPLYVSTYCCGVPNFRSPAMFWLLFLRHAYLFTHWRANPYASSTLLPNTLFHGTTCLGMEPYSFFALDTVTASR